MAAFVFLLITQSGFLRIASAQQECVDYKECSNREELSSIDSVLCYAAYSCDNTKSISAGDQIVCDGVGACSNVQFINSNKQYCRAPLSCSNSTFFDIQYTHCQGALSCTNSIFNNVYEMNAYGELSLLNSTISVTGNSVDIHCFGHLACYGANIECIGASTCNIYCYSTGCVGMNTSGNGAVHVNNASIDTLEMNAATSFGLTAIDHNADDAAGTSNSDAYREWYQIAGIVTLLTDGAVCARGESSAQGVGVIDISNRALICSGRFACRNIGSIEGKHANVYCSAHWACRYSKVITDGNIICDGNNACRDCNIMTSANIHCSGRQVLCRNFCGLILFVIFCI